MAIIEFRNVNFKYPLGDELALKDINLDIKESDFVVLCGKSGCGKSTLLRHLKKNMTPYGNFKGSITYKGMEICQLDDRVNSTEIGFVQQNPDNQLVTDKVWHELAFGLESLGLDNKTIKLRVSEMANFFDIQTWFRKSVYELSGGQKQLINLASVMVMQPEILILDEPTSQLDPIAADEFMRTLYKINREIGTTIIISEHRLEQLFTMADSIVVMDNGSVVSQGSPRTVGEFLQGMGEEPHPMFYGLPSIMKIHAMCKGKDSSSINSELVNNQAPLTIREGRLWIKDIVDYKGVKKEDLSKYNSAIGKDGKLKSSIFEKSKMAHPPIITIKDGWFRYSKETKDVLRGLNLEIQKGELFCLLGGNGAGKSTTLKAITGELKLQQGKITVDNIQIKKENLKTLFSGTLAMLPQNPQALFTEISVEEELLESLYYYKFSDDEKVDMVEYMLSLMEISHLRKSHPYDLSGGEQQRLALGKILMLKPKIILLDEPTKGLDPFFKLSLAKILEKLCQDGVTIFMVSHDIEFCAQFAHRCGLFFDGEIVAINEPKEFFKGNNFYTTSANRIVRNWYPDGVTWEEVLLWIEGIMES